MNQDRYLSRKKASELLGLHYQTLNSMKNRGDIEYIKMGTKGLYNVDKYLRDKGITELGKRKRSVCYCRVSSRKQSEDLERQIQFMKRLYPRNEIISDIGSGINMKRRGLNKIIDMAIKGEICEVIIAYRDRLARFGYDMIERIIQEYSKGEIIVINDAEEKTPVEEITEDIISIMNVYTAKINGLRKYKTKITNKIMNNTE